MSSLIPNKAIRRWKRRNGPSLFALLANSSRRYAIQDDIKFRRVLLPGNTEQPRKQTGPGRSRGAGRPRWRMGSKYSVLVIRYGQLGVL